MAASLLKLITIFTILISIFTPQAYSESDCETKSKDSCNNKSKALPLKIIAIVSILLTSMIGVCLPLFSRSVPALHPDKDLFVIVKAFAAGIILATGFMHVLPDSYEMLWSDCLKENPWHKFPFSGFLAMLSAILTLMVDSMATSIYSNKGNNGVIPSADQIKDQEMAVVGGTSHFHGHNHQFKGVDSQLLRYRVVAMVSFFSCPKITSKNILYIYIYLFRIAWKIF